MSQFNATPGCYKRLYDFMPLLGGIIRKDFWKRSCELRHEFLMDEILRVAQDDMQGYVQVAPFVNEVSA